MAKTIITEEQYNSLFRILERSQEHIEILDEQLTCTYKQLETSRGIIEFKEKWCDYLTEKVEALEKELESKNIEIEKSKTPKSITKPNKYLQELILWNTVVHWHAITLMMFVHNKTWEELLKQSEQELLEKGYIKPLKDIT